VEEEIRLSAELAHIQTVQLQMMKIAEMALIYQNRRKLVTVRPVVSPSK